MMPGRMKHNIAGAWYFGRTLLFIAGLWVISVMTGIVALLVYPFPYRFRFYTVINLWCYCTLFWMWITCGVSFKVIGKKNIPKFPCVILSKHSSIWETAALPVIFSAPSIVVKKQLLRVPFFGWSLGVGEPIVIDRERRRQAIQVVIKQGKRYLGLGRQVLLFPEGTRSSTTYKPGGAILAKEADVPILPVAHTASDCWSRRRFSIMPGKIHVIIGELIDTKTKTAEELTEQAKIWIEGTIEARKKSLGNPKQTHKQMAQTDNGWAEDEA